jgi:putative membrane protein
MNGECSHSGGDRFLPIVAGCYAALWIVLAIRPVDRGDWFLENLLVFVTVGLLTFTFRKFRFSNFSYALLAVFLALHALGAHYTYAQVPAGFWLRDLLHLERNHFDRVIHFGFGLLLLYPVREFLTRHVGARPSWVPWLALASIIAMSSFFEILEAIIAQVVHPDLGAAYLGTQGDIWDAQKDMVAAVFGAIIATALTTSRRGRVKGRD